MIINYRRVFHVGVKVNKTQDKEIIIVDYAKQCYPKFEEESKDNKLVFHFYYPDALRKFLDDVINRKIDSNAGFKFSEEYQNYIFDTLPSQTSSVPFYYAIKREHYPDFEKIASIIFDYLGSIYLIGKVRSVLQTDSPVMRNAI